MTEPRDIKSAPKKKPKTTTSKALEGLEIKPPLVCEMLIDAINRDQFSVLPEFPAKIHCLEPDVNSGARDILINDGSDVVRKVDDSYLTGLIMRYTRDPKHNFSPVFRVNTQAGQLCVDDWKHVTTDLIEVADVLWKDEPGYTYRRLPWARGIGPTPLWDDLTDRMGMHGNAFRAFVGSIFEKDADLQQYLYLYGKGGDGKGAIIRMLEQALGLAFKSEIVPTVNNQFWTHGLLNKRLVVFPDADPAEMLMSGKIKSILGGDSQRIEPKRKDTYSVRLRCKLMFCSNTRPNISSSPADMRRCLFIELPPLGDIKVDPSYEIRLWEETGYFISKCLDIYRELCPAHGPIPYDRSLLLEHLSTVDEPFEVFAEQTMEFFPREPHQLDRDRPFCDPARMDYFIKERFRTEAERRKFRQWLEISKGVRKVGVKLLEGNTVYRYLGAQFKDGMIMQ